MKRNRFSLTKIGKKSECLMKVDKGNASIACSRMQHWLNAFDWRMAFGSDFV